MSNSDNQASSQTIENKSPNNTDQSARKRKNSDPQETDFESYEYILNSNRSKKHGHTKISLKLSE